MDSNFGWYVVCGDHPVDEVAAGLFGAPDLEQEFGVGFYCFFGDVVEAEVVVHADLDDVVGAEDVHGGFVCACPDPALGGGADVVVPESDGVCHGFSIYPLAVCGHVRSVLETFLGYFSREVVMARFGSKLGYNDSDGANREADRVGFALGGVQADGRVKVQRADGSVGEFEFASDVHVYDKEHDGNRGDVAWTIR